MELEAYPFFGALDEASLQKVRNEVVEVSMGVGTFLYYQGDVCEGVLFLRRGCVKVFVHSEQIGRGEITLYYITPGEQCLVNTMSAVSGSVTGASAVVDESIEGWLLPASTVRWLVDYSPAFRDYKLSYCAGRLTQLLQLVEELRFKRMDQRLLNWLYVQGRDTVHTTHEQIAQILGTSREVISRILKNLEREGIVVLGRGSIRILEAH